MSAIFGSFLGMVIKAVFLFLVALAGIVCGKKFRQSKDAKKEIEEK